MVHGPVGQQDTILHTVEEERCECDDKKKLTVGKRRKKRVREQFTNDYHKDCTETIWEEE